MSAEKVPDVDLKTTTAAVTAPIDSKEIIKKSESDVEEDGGSSANESESEEKYDHSDKSSGSDSMSIEGLRLFLAEKLGLTVGEIKPKKKEKHDLKKIIEPLTFEGLMARWKTKPFKNIITMVGAGISTSAGIPDFRSPNTGLYNNLQKYNLPYPTAVFQLDYFMDNPKPFFSLAKELYPGNFKPTPCHYFIRLLQDKGILLRHYTQNIDTLDRIAGIRGDKLVEAHGTFHTGHCLKCHREHSQEYMRQQIFADKIPQCLLKACGGIVKPDIVFFGENLPEKFYTLPEEDFAKCDLLLIMGTSLEVQPFASLINRVEDDCLRILVNRDKVGQNEMFWDDEGLLFNSPNNTRDVAWLGDCDDGAQLIADYLGFGAELKRLIIDEHDLIDKAPVLEEGEEEEEKTDVSAKTTPSTETI